MAGFKCVLFICYLFMAVIVLGEAVSQIYIRYKHQQSPYELGASAFKRVRLYMSDHPYLPYIATKGKAYVNEDSWGDAAPVEFNSFGDRGAEPDNPKRRIRLIAFGGSTTFGARSSQEETWPGQLETLLGADQYEVINAAQNGATTADTLINLSLIHVDLQPDYILIYHGTNDLESSYAVPFRSDYAHRRRDIANIPEIFEVLPRWLDHSALYVLGRSAFLGNKTAGNLWARYTRRTEMDYENGPFGLDTFRRNLNSIVAVARANGAKVLIGTFQYYKESAERNFSAEFAGAWERGINEQNKIIREIAASNPEVILADVAAAFEPSAEYLWDFCHLTPGGNEKVARAFHSALITALEGGSRLISGAVK
jgi:lysophospholipase L1-like esterase